MSNFNRILVWMILFFIAVLLLGVVLLQPLREAFFANQAFNGVILCVLIIGIVVNFRQVFNLKPDIDWINALAKCDTDTLPEGKPRLMQPMARMLAGRNQGTFKMSAMTMRSLLDGIRMRLDEARDISRYIVGLLIFLGLLGTFWGLLDTIGGVASVVSGLSSNGGMDLNASFDRLIGDLQQPLSGMGTAFSSSLFGLAGALIVGFFDLQSGHAQNRFFNELEEWLSDLAHLSGGLLGLEADRTLPGYIEALLERTADNLDRLQREVARGEEERKSQVAKQAELTAHIAELADQIRQEQKLIVGLGKGQKELQPAITQLAEQVANGWAGDEEMRRHVRNMDLQTGQLLSEISGGRDAMLEELRSELRLLSQAIARHTKE